MYASVTNRAPSSCSDHVELLIPSISASAWRNCTASGPSTSRQRTAVAGLARLLEGRGGGANAGCADRLRGALELVRGGGQCRKIAGAARQRRSRVPPRSRCRGISPAANRSRRDRRRAKPQARRGRLRRRASPVRRAADAALTPRSAASVPALRAAGRCSPASPDRRPCRMRGSALPRPSWRWQ